VTRATLLLSLALVAISLAIPIPVHGAVEDCEVNPRPACFGLESVSASLSNHQAGAHPDLSFEFNILKNPNSPPNVFGLKDSYAATRNVRFELPPGLIGEPNVIGDSQLCTVEELTTSIQGGESCPNGSQVGVTKILAYELKRELTEPVYMMQAPGGDSVARLGFIAGLSPAFVDLKLRSEGDYGLTAELVNAPAVARLIRANTTAWGVPAASVHDTERCTPSKVISEDCVVSAARPPGSRKLPFMTNPTSCGVPLEVGVAASSWVEPQRFDTKSTFMPSITGCDGLPFGPVVTVEPTTRRAGVPTGLELTISQDAATGVEVLEPSQIREIRFKLPPGMVINTGAAEGLATCSEDEVRFGKREAAHCSDAAKIAGVDLDIPALPRRMSGAIYLRQPEPGNLFRFWLVADDLGAHVKLPGKLQIDQASGEVESITLDPDSGLTGLPQAPLREAKVTIKSGFRAPLLNPESCGTYMTSYELVPWSGGEPAIGQTPMRVDEGCAGTGRFSPDLDGGTTDPTGGSYSPFVFTLTREDGELNPAALGITLPQGLAANFSGIPRCGGLAATTGACPAGSRIGRVVAATGAGAAPLWVPQPGARSTAVYLGGPYKGAPFSAVAVVPAQAGPFDLGDVVVRSAISVDPVTARGSVQSDPLPQIIEGIPLRYRTVQVILDREPFTLNPTSCDGKEIEGRITATTGAVAKPSARFRAVNCARLPFHPRLSFFLKGGTRRGGHPQLRAVTRAKAGDANIGTLSVALPHSEFLDQSHIGTVCTRVQFAADQCPAASIYGRAVAKTPLFDQPLKGNVYLRSSSNPLPDLVLRFEGDVEVVAAGRIDSVNGGVRSTFDFIPDAPLEEVVLLMRGGRRGLLENSTNLCAATHRATVKFRAHNGRRLTANPPMKVKCKRGDGAERRRLRK